MNRNHETWHDPEIVKFCQKKWNINSEKAGIKRLAAVVVATLSPAKVMLDVGCGIGRLYRELVPDIISTEQYIGVDISLPMLEAANELSPDGRFWPGDLYGLEFGDELFDIVACFAVLGHIPDIEKPIAEMIRVTCEKVIFDVWPAESGTVDEVEEAGSTKALHRSYSHEVVLAAIGKAAAGIKIGVETLEWGSHSVYIVTKL